MVDTFKTNEKLFRSLPKMIRGSNVVIMDDIKKAYPELLPPHLNGEIDSSVFEKGFREENPIQLRIDKGSISFTLQTGPSREVGVNGCQIDALIIMAREILIYFNEQYPCQENILALNALHVCLQELFNRTQRRTRQRAEGRNHSSDKELDMTNETNKEKDWAVG